jgi:LCCL domain
MMTRLPRAALALSATILLAACSSGASATPTPTVESATPSATAASTASPSAAESADATATANQTAIDAWRANATQYRGRDGEQFEFECPSGGEYDTVWGTDTYTDDSSVCTAAVHAGVITLDEPGTVTIEIRPGEDSYEESERNGVTSQPYPAWGGSFVVIDE